MRLWQSLIVLALAALTGVVVFVLSLTYFQGQELEKAEGRLSLYRSTVVAELERFSHLTYVLARDPFVIQSAANPTGTPIDDRLAAFAEEAGLDAIYLMNRDGVTIAASNAATPQSFLGQDYSFRPYFRDAQSGAQGRFYGIGATTGLPGYFIADGVADADAVIAIKIDLSKLEQSWRDAGEQVILANGDGIVLLASDPEYRYRALRPLDAAQRDQIARDRQFPGQPLDPLDWAPDTDTTARIDGDTRLHLTSGALPHDWVLHYFAPNDRAVTQASLSTGALAILGAFAWIAVQMQRTRRMGAALRASEEEEAQLRRANERLAQEIDDRRTAERRLKRTQGELERASRLAALGQLAASVTHELGQPIAAMRNHLAAAEIKGQPAPPAVADLVDRMEAITRQLKFFARTEPQDFGMVDLGAALRVSLDLVAPNVEALGAWIEFVPPDDPVTTTGSRLRLEQVMTNLLRNALDAAADQEPPVIAVSLGTDAGAAWFSIADNGPGLGAATLSELSEPFVTTRESGQGMGLGLAISAGIVNDHGAVMEAENGKDGGAIFRVRFAPAEQQDDAA